MKTHLLLVVALTAIACTSLPVASAATCENHIIGGECEGARCGYLVETPWDNGPQLHTLCYAEGP